MQYSRISRLINQSCMELNAMTGSPMYPFSDNGTPSVGHFYADRITGGWGLFRTVNTDDGRQKFTKGPVSSRELLTLLDHFLEHPPVLPASAGTNERPARKERSLADIIAPVAGVTMPATVPAAPVMAPGFVPVVK